LVYFNPVSLSYSRFGPALIVIRKATSNSANRRVSNKACMPKIVAGRFDQQAAADIAMAALLREGFGRDQVTSFFVSSPGQHAHFPLGGDRAISPGAKTAGSNAAIGAAVGAALGVGVGMAAAPGAGPAAVPVVAGVGAYIGSLAGALSGMDDKPADTNPYTEPPAEIRRAGVMVAAYTVDPPARSLALEVLQASGAQDVETAEGTWLDGRWVDFDPIAPPGAEPGGPLTAPRPQHIRK
jgi:hypothetical protein